MHSAPNCRIRHEIRLRLDYYMLTSGVFIDLLQTHAESRHTVPDSPLDATQQTTIENQSAKDIATRAKFQALIDQERRNTR